MTKFSWKKITAFTLGILMLLQMSCISVLGDESSALAAINAASSSAQMETAILGNEADLTAAGISLAIFNGLSQASKDVVTTALVSNPDYDGLASGSNPFATALSTAVQIVTVVRFSPVVEDLNYISWSSGTNENNQGNWVEKILYKLDVSRPMYKSDFALQHNVVVRKNGDGRNNDIVNGLMPNGTVSIKDIPIYWDQYRDTANTINSNGIISGIPEYSYSFPVSGLGVNTNWAFDLTEFINIKANSGEPLTAIYMEGLPAGFFVTSESDSHKLGVYTTFDKKAIFDAFNSATSENIGKLIEENGEVFLLNVSEYINLCTASKSEVNNALLAAKPFADFSAIVSVYDSILDTLLVKQKYNIAEDYRVFFQDNPPGVWNYGDNNIWLSDQTNVAERFDFDLSAVNTEFIASKRMYVRARGNSWNGKPYGLRVRDLYSTYDESYTGVAQNILSIQEYPGIGEAFYQVDISDAIINGDGMMRIGLSAVTTDIYGTSLVGPYLSPKNDGETNMPYVYIGYDKLGIATGVAQAGSLAEAEAILETYHSMLGIADDPENDYSSMAGLLLGETIESAAQLQQLLTSSGDGVKIGGLSAGAITDGNIDGTVTIKNFTDSAKAIKVIIAAYTIDNIMISTEIVDTSADNGMVPAGAISTYNYALQDVSNASVVRAFLWNSFANLTPYSMPKAISVE